MSALSGSRHWARAIAAEQEVGISLIASINQTDEPMQGTECRHTPSVFFVSSEFYFAARFPRWKQDGHVSDTAKAAFAQ